jgi:hypothetical protein
MTTTADDHNDDAYDVGRAKGEEKITGYTSSQRCRRTLFVNYLLLERGVLLPINYFLSLSVSSSFFAHLCYFHNITVEEANGAGMISR